LGDSGLLAAAAATGGIPHPPGFPSYVLVGHLFTKLPWGSVAWRLGLISVIASAGIIALIFRTIQHRNGAAAAFAASVFLAFSYSFWSQAVNVETYALTNFVIMLASFLVWQDKSRWSLIGILLGVGAGLNPIIIAIIPSLIFISLARGGLVRLGLGAWVAVVVALMTYSYLPVRASTHPFLNWGDPSTGDRFLRHVTGGGLNILSSTAVNGFTGSIAWYGDAWVRFGHLLAVNTLGVGIMIIALGGYSLYIRDRARFWYWILLVFTNVSLAGLYTSGNRDSWFIMSFIAMAVFLGEGIHALWSACRVFASSRSRPPPLHTIFFAKAVTMLQNGSPSALFSGGPPVIVLYGIFFGISLLPLIVWFPTMRHRAQSTFMEAYIVDLYRDLPQGAILVGGGETFNALTVYAREAMKLRPDVTPVDFTIYYGQAWYRENLKAQSAKLKIARNEMPLFTDALEMSRMLEQFIAANSDRPAFVTGYLLRQPVYGGTTTAAYVPQSYQLEQHGVVYRVIASDSLSSRERSPEATDRGDLTQSYEIASPRQPAGTRNDNLPWYVESNYRKALDIIRMEYALALETEGVHLLRNGQEDQAFVRFTRAGEIAPAYFDQNRLGAIIRMAAEATASALPSDR
jgi:hypothetical protein